MNAVVIVNMMHINWPLSTLLCRSVNNKSTLFKHTNESDGDANRPKTMAKSAELDVATLPICLNIYTRQHRLPSTLFALKGDEDSDLKAAALTKNAKLFCATSENRRIEVGLLVGQQLKKRISNNN